MPSNPVRLVSDPHLPWLQSALDPAEVERNLGPLLPRLGASPGQAHLCAIRLVRHKPGLRALVEYDLDVERPGQSPEAVTLIGKMRAAPVDKGTYQVMESLWNNGFGGESMDGVSVPQPIGIVPRLGMWFQRKVPGVSAADLLPGRNGTTLARRIAEAIRKLHLADVRPRRQPHTIASELRILHERLTRLAHERPAWSRRLERVLAACDRLSASLPAVQPRRIHRDFYQDNLIVDGPRVYLLDLDLLCEGDPALDVGNFVGHLTELSMRTFGNPAALADGEEALVERFVELSGEETRRAVRAYATLTLVRHVSISTQFPGRRMFTEALLELCEQRLLKYPILGNVQTD